MPKELLSNNDLTAEYAEDNEVLVVEPRASGTLLWTMGSMANKVPPGWGFAWVKLPGLHLAENKEIHASKNPERVPSGYMKAQVCHAANKRYEAYWFQRVAVEGHGWVTYFAGSYWLWPFEMTDTYLAGPSLTFSDGVFRATAWMHAWSNHNVPGFDSYRDPKCSVGVCCGPIAMLKADAPLPNTGDPLTDAIANATLRIGVDPTGEINPLASTVVWSDEWLIYNGYAKEITLAVDTKAGHEQPTTDYKVTVRVPAQNTESYLAVAKIGSEAFNDMASYTSAGRLTNAIGPDGQGGLAILYDIPQDEHERYRRWYAEQFPISRLSFEYTEQSLVEKWIEFLLAQGDDEWANYVYKLGECFTLASQGCWIANCAMAQLIFGLDPNATPITVDKILGKEGYQGCLMLWSQMPKLGLEVLKSTTNEAEAKKHLDNGGLLFIEVEPSSLMHFVLGVEHSETDFFVLDPWKNKAAWLSDLYTGAESFRLVAEIEDEPPTPSPPPPPDRKRRLGLHMQIGGIEGSDVFYRGLGGSDRDRPIAKVFGPDDVPWVLAQNPFTTVLLRNYIGNQEPYVWPDDGDYYASAERWVDHVWDGIRRACDRIAREFPGMEKPYFWFESVNEEHENVKFEKNQAASRIDYNVAKVLYDRGYPVRGAIYCAPVGNMHPTMYPHFVHLYGDACTTFGAIMVPHRYYVYNGVSGYGGPGHLAEHLAMRYEGFDRALAEAGYEGVVWGSGETGAIFARTSPPEDPNELGEGWVDFDAHDGWKSPKVYNGNWTLAVDHLLQLSDMIQHAAPGRRGDDVGDVLFTSNGHWQGWEWFKILSPQFGYLKEAQLAR